MSKKPKREDKPAERPTHGTARPRKPPPEGQATGCGPSEEPASFSRWAMFEKGVLSKVEHTEECKQVIAERQAQVDDEANEADLVAAHFRAQLREHRLDPETCRVFFTTAELTEWLVQATGMKSLAIN